MKREKSDFGVLLLNVLPFDKYPLSESLGIEWLNAIVRSKGYPCRALVLRNSEFTFAKVNEEISNGVRVIGFSVYSETADAVFDMAAILRRTFPNIHLCVGGPLTLFHADEILHDCPAIDTVVVGEGYDTLVELLDRCRGGEELEPCAGLCFRREDTIVRTAPRPNLRPLDSLPRPTRSLLMEDRGTLFASLITAQGCPGNCCFCTETAIFRRLTEASRKPVEGKVRYGSVDRAVSEMESVHLETAYDTFEIDDSSFEGHGEPGKQRLRDFSRQLKYGRLPLYFCCNFRAESFSHGQDDELVKALSDAGLVLVFIGIESGHDSTLRLFRKRARVRDNLASIDLFRKHGINVEIGFIMFHPLATLGELRTNGRFLADAGFAWDIDMFTTNLALFPGMPFVDVFRKMGNILTDRYSYRRPYEYRFSDQRVGAFHDYLQKEKPTDGTSFAVSHRLLEVGTLVAKLRLDPALGPPCEAWYAELAGLRCEFGRINERWFLACLDGVERGKEGLLWVAKEEWDEAKRRGRFTEKIERLIEKITTELDKRKRAYTVRSSPWGDVVFPQRVDHGW